MACSGAIGRDGGTNRPIPMTLAEQAAADAALLEAQRDSIAEQLDQQEDILRAVMTAVIAELNGHADKFNAILAAAAAANNLASFKAGMGAITDYPQRTIQQLRNVVRNALGS